MPVNHYFQGGRGIGNDNEKRLYENLIIESLKIHGQDIYYLPRTLVNRDIILGEDTSSRFDDSYMVEMYMETTDGFAGQQEIINKFGLEIREDTTFTVAKRSFENFVSNTANLIANGRPNEGDILYMPLMNSFFEIQFVEDQEPFFQLGQLPVYKLRVTRWEYSSEELNTGVSAIDGAEEKYSLNELNYQLSLERGTLKAFGTASISSGTVTGVTISQAGNYSDAPTVTFSEPTSGTVAQGSVKLDANGGVQSVIITNAGTGYTSAPTVTFTDSTLTGSIVSETDSTDGTTNFIMNEDYIETNVQTQSPYADNNDLDTAAGFDTSSATDDILDFTERNPFGDEDL